jgi:predicted DNA binding CopG/RHH family protein
MEKVKEPRINCRIPDRLLTRIQRIAAVNGIDQSDVIRIGMDRVLEQFEKGGLNLRAP